MKIIITLPPHIFNPVQLGSAMETVAQHFYKEHAALTRGIAVSVRNDQPVDGFVTDPHIGLLNFELRLK